MIGNILGEPFSQYVYDQIEARQKIQGSGLSSNRTPQEINYLNNRNSFIKLASGVEIENNENGWDRLQEIGLTFSDINNLKGKGLAENYILFNGTSKLSEKGYIQRSGIRTNFQDSKNEEGKIAYSPHNTNNMYGLGGKEFGLQPPPGILSVNVDCINRGSIRTATVILHAHNKFQFELIELLYLRLGYSMMLEWGWNEYIEKYDENKIAKISKMGNTIIENFWFKKDRVNQSEILTEIEKYREDYKGNYEGFFGKVTNFEWNLDKNGIYVITLKLVTVGDVIESLKVNIPNEIKADVNESNKNEIENNVTSELTKNSSLKQNYSSNSIVYYLYKKVFNWEEDIKNNHPPLQFDRDFYQIPFTKSENDDTNSININYSYYIRLGKFLEELIRLVIPVIDNNGSIENMLEIDTSIDNVIYLESNLFPIDPRICIMNMSNIKIPKQDDITKKLFTQIPTSKSTIINDLNQTLINTSSNKSNKVHSLMDLYMGFEFLSNAASKTTSKEGHINLFKFLERICDGINTSFNNYTKLEPIIKDDKIITLIDQKTIPGILQEPPSSKMEIFGYNKENNISNFVKDINFNTKITPALASQISIGATAGNSSSSIIDGTAFSKWNIGLKDRFSLEIKLNQPPSPTNEQNITTKDQAIATWNKSTDDGEDNVEVSYSKLGAATIHRLKTKNIIYNGVTYNNITEIDWVRKFRDLKNAEKKSKDGNANKMFLFIGDWGAYIKNILSKDSNYFTYNSNFISRGKALFQKYITQKANDDFKNKEIVSNLIGFIPITLDLTIEGLSGIKIYQKLNIKQRILPYQYNESFNFLITKVNHTIENNNWDTVLSTLSTSNIKEISEPLPTDSTPPPTPLDTPNADALRLVMGKYGINEKELNGNLELSSNGDITKEMADYAEKVFDLLFEKFKFVGFEVTGGNDIYHSNKSGRHKDGRGIDFTVLDPHFVPIVTEYLKEKNISFLDEYTVRTENSTGGHFHISVL